jgi:putative transposase
VHRLPGSGMSWLCEVMEVSRSGFHAWLHRPASARAILDTKLVTAIDRSFKASDRTYGARRVRRDVLEDGLACGLHRIERLMRKNAMRARPKRRGKPKDDGERSIIADNILDRDFDADRPNQKWLADFTYIWTVQGWLYVAVVLDLFSRRVVGWSMQADRDARLVMDALIPLIDCYAINCRAMDGCLAPRQGRRAAPPFGPGIAIYQ